MMSFPSHIIPRPQYIEKLKAFINKPLAKVLTGQRRVGKSYLLYQIIELIQAEEHHANIIYINKEDISFDFITDYKELYDHIIAKSVKNRKNYIFIDEVQEIEGFEKAVRSLLLDENNDIYLTGSNAKLLSGELATLLSGRSVELTVYSLSYSEFLDFHRLKPGKGSLENYFKYGGFPYLVNLPLKDSIVFEYLKNIYTAIVYRDIVARHKIRNIHFLERLIRFLADNIGSVFSKKSISDFLKSQNLRISHSQVQSYLDALTEAFLVQKIMRYDITGKKYFEFGEKYYFENTGIRNAVAGYKPDDKAKLLENIVYNHLLFKGYHVKVGKQGSHEIDFIAEKDNERQYIQVTLALENQKTIEREFGNLLKIKDNYPKKVITLGDDFRNSYQGIECISLEQFLL
jgi:predicted AAA+ superfamily ATPase